MMFDLEMVTRITAGKVSPRSANCPLQGVSTDSRSVTEGQLFIPLRGPRFDGHEFFSQAVSRGAAACLSEDIVDGLSIPVVKVDDTLRALGDLAAAYRQNLRGPLIGITGSSGKTTTKEMLASILSQKNPGLKTAGNFNNLIGLPLTLFELQPEHCWAVIEMGTSALGEIERLTEIAAPDIGVITNVGPAHLETLKGLAGVARAKGELFAGLHGGTAVVNLDDQRVTQLPVANGVARVTFGVDPQAQIRASDLLLLPDRVEFCLHGDGKTHMVELAVPGQHNVSNALAAAATAHILSVPMEDIVTGLQQFSPAAGRMVQSELPGGGVLLDDSYNSNPMSAAAGLEVLRLQNCRGQKIAVLGDMLELGERAEQHHQDLGRRAADCAELIIAVGQYAGAICQGAASVGMPDARLIQRADSEAAVDVVLSRIECGDGVLVKGSRGVHLETLVEAIKTHVVTHCGQED